MSNFEFVFNVQNAPTQNDGDENRPAVDWAARTKYMVDNCGTKDKAETEIFIITGVVDLGMHIQEDAKMEFKGDAAAEAAELEKNPNQYFETLLNDKKVPTRYKRWKITKPQQMVGITVDNPKRMLDIAQFHDENADGTLHPLRMLLNNEFYQKPIGKIVNKMGYSTKEVKNDDGTWSFKNNTTLYKLAKAVGVLDDKGHFKPAHMGKLIGKAILCEFQVFTNQVGDKEYLNEKVSFKGEVPSMMKDFIPAIDSSYFYGVNFDGAQDPAVLKNLRQSMVTTMQAAVNFEGSDIQKALIEIGRVRASTGEQNTSEGGEAKEQRPNMAKSDPAPQPAPDFDAFDDDIPF